MARLTQKQTTTAGLMPTMAAHFALTDAERAEMLPSGRQFILASRTFFEKSGAEGSYRRLKFEILAIVRENIGPEFASRLETPADKSHWSAWSGVTSSGTTSPPCRRPGSGKRRGVGSGGPGRREGAYAPLRLPVRRDHCEVPTRFPRMDIYALKAEFDAWTAERTRRAPRRLSGGLLWLHEGLPQANQGASRGCGAASRQPCLLRVPPTPWPSLQPTSLRQGCCAHPRASHAGP